MKSLYAALLLFACPLAAQVPNLIPRQGRAAVNGVNFDGTGQFKFALVNAAGTVTCWSYNGSSTSAMRLQSASAPGFGRPEFAGDSRDSSSSAGRTYGSHRHAQVCDTSSAFWSSAVPLACRSAVLPACRLA